jgi:opacity protein-like surface antigen
LLATDAFQIIRELKKGYSSAYNGISGPIFLGGMRNMGAQNGLQRVMRIGCVAVMLMMFGGSRQSFADNPDYQGPFVKLHGGLNFALDSDYNGSGPSFPSGDASLEAGAIVGMAGGYRFNRSFAADLEYSYRRNDIDKIEGSGGMIIADGGDLASVAIIANGYYFFHFSDTWSPYLGLGVGLLQEIDSDVELVGISDQKDLEDQVFAWQAMLGAEVPLDESWRFYGEGRFMSAPGTDLSNGNGSYRVDYNNLSLIAGIGYQF